MGASSSSTHTPTSSFDTPQYNDAVSDLIHTMAFGGKIEGIQHFMDIDAVNREMSHIAEENWQEVDTIKPDILNKVKQRSEDLKKTNVEAAQRLDRLASQFTFKPKGKKE